MAVHPRQIEYDQRQNLAIWRVDRNESRVEYRPRYHSTLQNPPLSRSTVPSLLTRTGGMAGYKYLGFDSPNETPPTPSPPAIFGDMLPKGQLNLTKCRKVTESHRNLVSTPSSYTV